MARDFYEILGVKKDATEDQIKRAYRTLAKKYHPDRNPDSPAAEKQFKEVQEAYNTLSNKEKRAQYDQFGAAGVGHWRTTPQGQRVYQWGGGSAVDVEDLEDLFSAFGGGAGVFDQFFGGRGGRTGGGGRSGRGRAAPGPRRAPDHEQEVTIPFEQAFHGTTLSLQLTSGQNGRSEQIEVKIPAGVKDGQRIRVRGRIKGEHGDGPGDLFLRVRVLPHAYFTRDGADLSVEAPVTVTEAALGAKIEVPTMGGLVTMTLPPGTPSGTRLRLAGRGAPKPGGSDHGDQYVVIKIVPPKSLSGRERELFEQLRSLETSDPRDEAPWKRR